MIIALALPASAMENIDYLSADNVDKIAGNDYAITFDVTYVWDDCYESIVDIIGLNPTEGETEVVVIEEENESQKADAEIEPYATTITSMVIHRTKHPEGSKSLTTDSTKYVADDLTFNDYSYSDLCAQGSIFAVANVTAESLMWSEMAAIFAAAKRTGSSMNDVLDDLVDTFRNGNSSNEGTSVEVGDIYTSSKYIKHSNTTLTNAVKADEATLAYLII